MFTNVAASAAGS